MSRWGRLRASVIGVVMTLAVLVAPAMAMGDDGPVAIGQDAQGISYVGYGDSGVIARYDANGNPLSSWNTQSFGIIAISVDPSGNVWVLDSGYVSEYSASGALTTTWHYEACAGDSGVFNPAEYGGLAVTANAVYIASPCFPDIWKFARTGGVPEDTYQLPDSAEGRGVTVGPAGTATNQVFVAVPNINLGIDTTLNPAQGEVLTFNSSLTPDQPAVTVDPSGSPDWSPAGIADKQDSGGDELIVSDAENDYLYVYDPGHLYGPNGTYSEYRTLGHGQGSAAGSVDDPAAIALHADDGSDLDSNVFIADFNNNRIQRWNDSGYTWWTAAATAPSTVTTSVPANTTLPTVTGDASAGSTLTCDAGMWTGSPTLTYQWREDGVPDGDYSTTDTLTTTSSDVGHVFSCAVIGTNTAGASGPVDSTNNVEVTPAADLPVGVTVDGGLLYTNSTSVTVDVIAPAGTTQVTLSNDGSFLNAQTFSVNPAGQYSWSLQSAGAERLPKTVYVRFTAPDVPSYLTLTDDIIVDTTAPTANSAQVVAAFRTVKTAQRALAQTARQRNGWTLKVKASDALSGVAKLQYASSTKAKRITTVKFSKLIHLTSLTNARYVRVIDRAGNYGRWVMIRR